MSAADGGTCSPETPLFSPMHSDWPEIVSSGIRFSFSTNNQALKASEPIFMNLRSRKGFTAFVRFTLTNDPATQSSSLRLYRASQGNSHISIEVTNTGYLKASLKTANKNVVSFSSQTVGAGTDQVFAVLYHLDTSTLHLYRHWFSSVFEATNVSSQVRSRALPQWQPVRIQQAGNAVPRLVDRCRSVSALLLHTALILRLVLWCSVPVRWPVIIPCTSSRAAFAHVQGHYMVAVTGTSLYVVVPVTCFIRCGRDCVVAGLCIGYGCQECTCVCIRRPQHLHTKIGHPTGHQPSCIETASQGCVVCTLCIRTVTCTSSVHSIALGAACARLIAFPGSAPCVHFKFPTMACLCKKYCRTLGLLLV